MTPECSASKCLLCACASAGQSSQPQQKKKEHGTNGRQRVVGQHTREVVTKYDLQLQNRQMNHIFICSNVFLYLFSNWQ